MIRAMQALRIIRNEHGPRVYVVGRRLHHGPAFATASLLALRARRPRTAAILATIAATDWRDFPFRDCDGGHDIVSPCLRNAIKRVGGQRLSAAANNILMPTANGAKQIPTAVGS